MPVLLMPAEVTHAQAGACAAMLRAALNARNAQPGDVVLDASALSTFDSSAIAVMLDCRREALATGRGFEVSGLPTRLRALAGLYGVEPLLPATSSP